MKKKKYIEEALPEDNLLFGMVITAGDEPTLHFTAQSLRYVGDAVGDEVLEWHNKYRIKLERMMKNCYSEYKELLESAKERKLKAKKEISFLRRFINKLDIFGRIMARGEVRELEYRAHLPVFAIHMTPSEPKPVIFTDPRAYSLIKDSIGDDVNHWHYDYTKRFQRLMENCYRDYLKLIDSAVQRHKGN